MMEGQKNTCEHCQNGGGCCQGGSCGGNCGGGYGGWCRGHKHFLLRWVLMLVILGGTFCLGVKVGELKSLLKSEFGYGHGGYGYRMMQGSGDTWNYPVMMKGQSMPMMQSESPAKQ